MADKRILELSLHTSLTLSDVIPIVSNNETKKTTYGSLYYGIRDGVVSGSSQIDYTQITNVPSNLISGSSQITILGFVSSSITGSSVITASFDTNTRNLTFTKGNSTQFSVNIPDVSGSSLPAGVVSGSSQVSYTGLSNIPSGIVSGAAQVTPLLPSGTVSGSTQVSAITGSSLVTASLSGNTVTFTKGDNTTFGFTIPDVSGSVLPSGVISGSQQITDLGFISSSQTTNTGSLLTTASFSGNTLTFTKGDATTFGIVIPDVSGSVIPAGTISGSSQVDYPFISNIPAGIISSSQQLPSGLVSGSSQLTASYDLRYELSGALQPLPSGLVSGSTQIIELGFQTTASFNSYTQSNDSKINNLINATSSYAISSSVASVDAEQQVSINALNAATSSYATSAITGSSLVTASLSGNTITFTKGDNTTFGFTIPDVSGSSLPLGVVSGSEQITSFGFVSGSYETTGRGIVSSSAQITSFGFISSSQTIDTGSFATTGSNQFNGNQTITGSLVHGNAGNIATGEKSHAEGEGTQAIGNFSHAEGLGTIAYGNYSHAEGQDTIASGSHSHTEGKETIALANHQHVQGKYNLVSSAPAAFIVGNGTDSENRSNLIHAAGNEVEITGSLKVSGSTILSGSLFISGTSEFGGDLVPRIAKGATLGTLERPFREIYIQSASLNIASDIPGGRGAAISNADGNVTIQAAGLQLKSGSFISFEVSETARTIIRVPFIPAGDIGALSIIGNSSGSYQPVTNAGGLIHLTGNDGVSSRITSDAFGTTAFAAYVGRKARGTAANPLPVQSNDTLTRISAIGWTGPEYGFTMSSSLTTAPTSLDVIALENFTTSSFGTAFRLFNTPIGNTTRVLSAQIDTSGLFVSGTFTSSLEEGYTWVGGNGNRTTLVSTASFEKTGRGILSGSISYTSLTNIPSGIVSGSSQISFNGIIDKPTLVSGSSQVSYTGLSNIPSGIVSSSTQIKNYGDFATTGSNTFIGTETISGSLQISGSGFINNHRILTDLDSGSYAITGSNTFSGSQGISGSLYVSQSLYVTNEIYLNGNKLFNYGQFSDTTTQSGSADTAYSMKFNSTDISHNISVVSGSRITVDNTGIYNLQFSAQLDNTSNTNEVVDIWIAVTGSNVPNSNTRVAINKAQAGNEGKLVAAWNYMLPLSASQYVELKWSSNGGHIILLAEGTTTGPTRPAVPSAIATITQIA